MFLLPQRLHKRPPSGDVSSSFLATLLSPFLGCHRMGQPSKRHRPSRPNSPLRPQNKNKTKQKKNAHFHSSPPKAQACYPMRDTAKHPEPGHRPASRLASLAAYSAVTAEFNARARFQTAPTWRRPAVRTRGSGAPGARGGEEAARAEKRMLWSVRSRPLLGGAVSPSFLGLGGGGCGLHPSRCPPRPPNLRHS